MLASREADDGAAAIHSLKKKSAAIAVDEEMKSSG